MIPLFVKNDLNRDIMAVSGAGQYLTKVLFWYIHDLSSIAV